MSARDGRAFSSSPLRLPQIETAYLKVVVLVIAALISLLLSTLLGDLKYLTEEKFGALGWALLPDDQVEERVTIVAIDERSLAEIGPWPWSREVLAELSSRLSGAGAAMQLYDIVLPEPREGDGALLASLGATKSVLAQIPVLDESQAGIEAGVLGAGLAGIRCQAPLPAASGYLANHSGFSSVAKGHITPVVDGDGMIRKQPPLICVDGRAYPSLSLQALLMGFNADVVKGGAGVELVPGQSLFSPAWNIQLGGYLGYKIPLDADGNVRISYGQSPDSFRVVSAAEVLTSSPSDPLLNDLLRDAWVLIGATAFGLGDVVPTPHSGMAPGVELQARLLVDLLDGSVPYTPVSAVWLLLLEGLVFAGVLLLLAMSAGRISIVGLPAAGVLLPLAALLLHVKMLSFDVWLGWFTPALFGLLAAVMMSLLEHRRVRLERQRVYGNLTSYLPAEAAREIAFNLPSGSIQASRRELVLICADLRNFSAYEAAHSSDEAAALLHYFFVKATEVVEAHGGSVEEFTGDSVLASWSVDPEKDAALQALQAANALQRVMGAIMPSPIALGVSVEKGPVLVGSIGPAHRRTHTLLGDTVTLALRIQSMTEELAQPILIGECAARALRGESLVSQGAYLLDGLRAPQVIYAPSQIDTPVPLDDVESSGSGGDIGGGGLRVISGGKD